MTIKQQIHEARMAGLNLRPKPRILCVGDGFGYSDGVGCWFFDNIISAVTFVIKRRIDLARGVYAP